MQSTHRGIGQDGNTLPTTGLPTALARGALPVPRGAGLNWPSILNAKVGARAFRFSGLGTFTPYGAVTTRGGLGQDAGGDVAASIPEGTVYNFPDTTTTPPPGGFNITSLVTAGLTAAGSAYAATVKANAQQQALQSQLLARAGYVMGPYGQLLPSGGLSLTGMTPLLLIGGGLLLVLMIAKR